MAARKKRRRPTRRELDKFGALNDNDIEIRSPDGKVVKPAGTPKKGSK